MKFSIIIPVYNVEKYLEECIASILCQSCRDYECILVDDGSTDRSEEICDRFAEEYPDHLRVIHQANGGLSKARNTGISAASGEYLIFVDSDDKLLVDNALASIGTCCNGCDIVSFDWKEVPDGVPENSILPMWGGVIHKLRKYYPTGEGYLLDALSLDHLYPWYVWKYAFKRSFWMKYGFKFMVGTKYEDVRLTPQVILAAKGVLILPEAIYHYRTGRVGSIVNEKNGDACCDFLSAISENIEICYKNRQYPDELRSLLANNLSCSYYAVVIHSTYIKDREQRLRVYRMLEETKWICSYTHEKKQCIARFFLKIFGIPFTAFLLGIRRKFRDA